MCDESKPIFMRSLDIAHRTFYIIQQHSRKDPAFSARRSEEHEDFPQMAQMTQMKI